MAISNIGETWHLRHLEACVALILEKNELSSPQTVRESKEIKLALNHAEGAINQQGLLDSTEKSMLNEFFAELRAIYLECSELDENGKCSYEVLRGSDKDLDDLIILKSQIEGTFFPAIQKMAFSRTSGGKASSTAVQENPAGQNGGNENNKTSGTVTTKGGRICDFFWKLYEKTLKVIVDAVFDRWWPT
ncbi:MAG: hypothetical protein WC496_03360 [Phycisphaerae bacterium]